MLYLKTGFNSKLDLTGCNSKLDFLKDIFAL